MAVSFSSIIAVEVAGSEELSGMISPEMRARWALGHWDSSGGVEAGWVLERAYD